MTETTSATVHNPAISTSILGAAVETSGNPAMLEPGVKYGTSETSRLDFVSLGLVLVFAAATISWRSLRDWRSRCRRPPTCPPS